MLVDAQELLIVSRPFSSVFSGCHKYLYEVFREFLQ